jgi:cerevisin
MRTAVALTLAAVAQASTFTVGTIHDGAAPILTSIDAETIPDSYIIKFRDHVDESSASSHHNWVQNIHDGGEQDRLELRKRGLTSAMNDVFTGMKHTFKIGDDFKGYAGHFHEDVIEQVRNHPDVSVPCIDSITWHLSRLEFCLTLFL